MVVLSPDAILDCRPARAQQNVRTVEVTDERARGVGILSDALTNPRRQY
jgi:hypothetical protein